MKIILDKPGERPKFYVAFEARKAEPVFSVHCWAALEFDTIEQAEKCKHQLRLLGFPVRIVD